MDNIRISKLLDYQGIGSIVNLVDNGSVIIASIKHWNDTYNKLKGKINDYVIHNARLEEYLEIDEIRKPINLSDRDKAFKFIPAFRFPLWHYCPVCGKMKKLNYGTRKIPYCDNTDHQKKVKIIPIWFVLVCTHGHIKDFPFDNYITHLEGCDRNKVYFETSKISSSTTNFYVKCKTCNISKPLPSFSSFKLDCDGSMPWYGTDDFKAKCQNSMSIIPVHSTSIYSAVNIRALLIKKSESDKEMTFVNERYNSLITMNSDTIESIIKMENLNSKKFWIYLNNYHSVDERVKLLNEEYLILNSSEKISDEYITVIPQDIFQSNILASFFNAVNMIPLLTETIVFKGFYRIDNNFEHTVDFNKKYKWLPGTELYGEGIFIDLDYNLLKEFYNYNNFIDKDNFLTENQVFYIIIHSLSHALIKELCKESGYLISEIKEKIYSSLESESEYDLSNAYGLLLYVTGSDRFGTLGGLCQLATPDKFEKILLNALINIKHCTTDPFCINQEIITKESNVLSNGSACHHCMYIPETSCSENNFYLDRSFLIGSSSKNIRGFFYDIEQQLH